MLISAKEIEDEVARSLDSSCKDLPEDILNALVKAREEETGLPRIIFDILIENAILAHKSRLPICQDTGIDVVLVEIGKDTKIEGDLITAINKGISKGTKEGFLRASVCDPITRKNTGDNTPGVIHIDIVKGDMLSIKILPKGCGSENMSTLKMLSPSSGVEGIIDFVVSHVKSAGPNPCPPGIVGVGIGGTMDKAAFLSKKAILRPIGVYSDRADVREIERAIFERINALGIGPLGFGGKNSCFWVAVEVYPCHIASLPVSVNIQCHAARMSEILWKDGKLFKKILKDDDYFSKLDNSNATLGFKNVKHIELPFKDEDLKDLRAGDCVFLSGHVLTGRDQTHKRIMEELRKGNRLPFSLENETIYYVGPTPAPDGCVIGSCGPTTSYRMDAYMPTMLDLGVRATIGKGKRSKAVIEEMKRHGAIYLATIGGAGAYLSRCIKKAEVLAFEDLGPEALFKLEVNDFPAIVINDIEGRDFYESTLKNF